MKRSTKLVLARLVLAVVLGALMVKAGHFLADWFYWAVLVTYFAYGYVCRAEGYARCREINIGPVDIGLFDLTAFLASLSGDEAADEAEDSGASDD